MSEREKLDFAISGLSKEYKDQIYQIGIPKTLVELESWLEPTVLSTLQAPEKMMTIRNVNKNRSYLEKTILELQKDMADLKAFSNEPKPVYYTPSSPHTPSPLDIAQVVGGLLEKQFSSAIAHISDLITSTLTHTWNQATSFPRRHRRNNSDQDDVTCSYCGKFGHCELRCRTKKYHERKNAAHQKDNSNQEN